MANAATNQIHEFVNTTVKEYGIKVTLDALRRETKILKYWHITESIRKNCKYPKLAEIVLVTGQKEVMDETYNGALFIEVEFTPNVIFSADLNFDEESIYELENAAISFNGKDYMIFGNAEETEYSILKMYKFLNLTDVPVRAFISIAEHLLGNATEYIDCDLSKKQLNSCFECSDSETSNESDNEPPSKKQKVDN